MEALVLLGGSIYIGVLGFWVMEKIDRFIGKGGFSPDWDEAEEREVGSKTGQAKICGSTDFSKMQRTVHNMPLT